MISVYFQYTKCRVDYHRVKKWGIEFRTHFSQSRLAISRKDLPTFKNTLYERCVVQKRQRLRSRGEEVFEIGDKFVLLFSDPAEGSRFVSISNRYATREVWFTLQEVGEVICLLEGLDKCVLAKHLPDVVVAE